MKRLFRLVLIAAMSAPLFATACIPSRSDGGWDIIKNPATLICNLVPANLRNALPFGLCR